MGYIAWAEDFLSLAFLLRTLADALAAFRATALRSSAVMVRSRALPPFLPRSERYFETAESMPRI
jgi:hypothetical protein